MRRDTRCFFAVAVAVLFLTVVPQVVFADHHEEAAPTYTMIHYEEVGPANAPAYEENSKAWVTAFEDAEMGEEWSWRTYSGPNFNYAFLTEVPNYAYLDGADAREAAMVEAIGQEKLDHQCLPKGRDRQVLRRRHHAQAQAARETEGR